MIIYFHGFYGSPKKEREEFFKTIADSTEYYEPKIDYQNPVESIEKLKEALREKIENNKDDTVMFVGSSLGGFLAEFFAHYFRCEPKIVLINPSMKPYETLLKYDGYTQEKANSFLAYRVGNRRAQTTVILDNKDDVIDLDYTRTLFADSSHIIDIYEDGHRFSKYEKYRHIFEQAYNNLIEC